MYVFSLWVEIIEGWYIHWYITINTGRKMMEHSWPQICSKLIHHTNHYLYIWGDVGLIIVMKIWWSRVDIKISINREWKVTRFSYSGYLEAYFYWPLLTPHIFHDHPTYQPFLIYMRIVCCFEYSGVLSYWEEKLLLKIIRFGHSYFINYFYFEKSITVNY